MVLTWGFGMRDITPPIGLPMGGYAARSGPAIGVLDALSCRAAVCSGTAGGGPLVLVSLDLLCVAEPWVARLRRRIALAAGCDTAAVLVAATHTHAGPAVFGSGGDTTAALAAYEAGVADAVVKAASEASARREPVELRFGRCPVPGVAASRRRPADDLGDEVAVLAAVSAQGRCAGAVASFACHPTVLPPQNRAFSRDLFGVAVDRAEQLLGAPVLLFNGAAADVSTRFTRGAQTPEEMRRLGVQLGTAIARAVSAGEEIAPLPLAAAEERVPLEFTALPAREEAERLVAETTAAYRAAKAAGRCEAELRQARAAAEAALGQLYLATAGGAGALPLGIARDAPLQALQLGECSIVGVPGELFSALGRRISEARGKHVLLVGYANGYVGYLLPRDACREGGYEAMLAVVTPRCAEGIALRLQRLGKGCGPARPTRNGGA